MKLKHLLLLLLILTAAQCTVEKRLYNKGFHIERKLSLSSESNKVNEQIAYKETISENSLEQEQTLYVSNGKVVNSVEIQKSHSLVRNLPKDTIYVAEPSKHKGWSPQKKKNALIAVGAGSISTGLIATSFLLKATAAGATFFEFAVLGLLGWILAGIAVILLLLFIIFLCIHTNDKPKRKSNSNLSKRERTALLVILSLFGIIGVIILLSNLFH